MFLPGPEPSASAQRYSPILSHMYTDTTVTPQLYGVVLCMRSVYACDQGARHTREAREHAQTSPTSSQAGHITHRSPTGAQPAVVDKRKSIGVGLYGH